MLEYAKELHERNPGDQVSAIDYGMALGRAASLPIRTGRERLALFAESRARLAEALRRDPANAGLRLNSASYERFAGEVAETERLNPIPHYDYALAILAEKAPGSRIVAADLYRRAGLYLARRGDAAGARLHAAKALAMAESGGFNGMTELFAQCRAYAASGLISRELREPDYRGRLERAIDLGKELEKRPGFIPTYRVELRQWEAARKPK